MAATICSAEKLTFTDSTSLEIDERSVLFNKLRLLVNTGTILLKFKLSLSLFIVFIEVLALFSKFLFSNSIFTTRSSTVVLIIY